MDSEAMGWFLVCRNRHRAKSRDRLARTGLPNRIRMGPDRTGRGSGAIGWFLACRIRRRRAFLIRWGCTGLRDLILQALPPMRTLGLEQRILRGRRRWLPGRIRRSKRANGKFRSMGKQKKNATVIWIFTKM